MTIESTVNSYWRGDGDGTNVIFTFPFSKFEDDDVLVYVYNTTTGAWDAQTVTTDYTISSSQVIFAAGKAPSAAPSTGFGNVLIIRSTDFQSNKALFTAGSSIRAKDLTDNFLQSIFADQEFRDLKVDKFAPEFWADVDMKLRRVKNLASPSNDSEAATKKYVDDGRTNTIVQDETPSAEQEIVGLHWVKKAGTEDQVHHIYNGVKWVEVASGIPFTPQTGTKTRYVDVKNGLDTNEGTRRDSPLRTIKAAVQKVNADSDGDGTLIWVNAGVYQETLPITIEKENVSIVGTTQRSCFIHPTQGTETNTIFKVNSGTYIANFTFAGLKAGTVRGGSGDDPDVTYGLPATQGWVIEFKDQVEIKKSPYIQNCVSYNDSEIDNTLDEFGNSNFNPNTMAGLGGDQTSAMCGGGIKVDGSKVASNSPLKSMVVDAFTQLNLNGPGILCTNNGYAQCVSFFGTFCHYHAKALNGGQLNLSNCVTDFGTYGLIADGKSPSAIDTATVNTAASSGDVTVTVTQPTGGLTPGTVHLIEIGSNTYSIKAVAPSNNNTTWNVTVHNPQTGNVSNNLGIVAAVSIGDTVNFYQKSLITTGGHVFEWCGVGTDYSVHPYNGGQADITKQVVELNDGAVYRSSTDENGRFVVGGGGSDAFVVDQTTGSFTVPAGTVVATNIETDTTPQLGGPLDTNGFVITSAGNADVTIDPAGSGRIKLDGPVDFEAGTLPEADTSSKGIVQLTTTYQGGENTYAATPSAVKSLVPVGTIMMFAGSSAPNGYLGCHGQTINTTMSNNAYTDLVGVLAGSGANVATVPNLVDKFIVGANVNSGDETYPGLSAGQTGGSEDAVVVEHNHTADSTSTPTVTDTGHFHYAFANNYVNNDNRLINYAGQDVRAAAEGAVGNDSRQDYKIAQAGGAANTGRTSSAVRTSDISVSTSTTTTIENEGVSETNANLPPYYALMFIIKY